jgi:hypothetical protein
MGRMNRKGEESMNFSKNIIISITLLGFLFAIAGLASSNVAADNETTITPTSTNVNMSDLTANICVTIKNNKNQPEFFSISQQYFQVTPTLEWDVAWTYPKAVKMLTNVNPTNVFNSSVNSSLNSTGDLGWEIGPGETKTVSFELDAVGDYGVFLPNSTTPNNFWPLIPDPGLSASFFLPNELQMLNPNLQIESWNGTFNFDITNINPVGPNVEGIIRAPIVPIDSELTFSDPKADFIDTSTAGADAAAWNVSLSPFQTINYVYSYHYPKPSNSSNIGHGSSSVFAPKNSTNNTTTVPSQNTGIPYGLLALAAVMVTAGVVYAKFLR